MRSISKLVRVSKAARVEKYEHCVSIQGSANYTQSINLDNLRSSGRVDGSIKGLSRQSLSRLRTAIASTAHTSGDYRVYGACITVPLSGITQEDCAEIWRTFTHHLGRVLDLWHIGIIYRVELQQRRAAHWHMMVYLPSNLDADPILAWSTMLRGFSDVSPSVILKDTKSKKTGRPMIDVGCALDDFVAYRHYYLLSILRLHWIKAVCNYNGATPTATDARSCACGGSASRLISTFDYCFNVICLDGVKSGIAYLASHTSKHKQEQLGWTGKQWGFLGRKWLVSSPPVDIVPAEYCSDRSVRIVAYRYIRKWARRNAFGSDWRVVRVRRSILSDGFTLHSGLSVLNTRSLFLFGPASGVVGLSFELARKTLYGVPAAPSPVQLPS